MCPHHIAPHAEGCWWPRAGWIGEDRVISPSQDVTLLPTDEGWLEQGLWAAEALVPNGDHLPIRQLVALLKGRGGCGSGHLIFKVQSYITQFLLDVPDNLTLSCQDTNIQVFTGGKTPIHLPYFSLSYNTGSF